MQMVFTLNLSFKCSDTICTISAVAPFLTGLQLITNTFIKNPPLNSNLSLRYEAIIPQICDKSTAQVGKKRHEQPIPLPEYDYA